MADFEDTVLNNVKEDLDISDDVQDRVLKRLISKVCDHFKLAYSTDVIEDKFSFIIEDAQLNVSTAEELKELALKRLKDTQYLMKTSNTSSCLMMTFYKRNSRQVRRRTERCLYYERDK
jgi:hypothetical protein